MNLAPALFLDPSPAFMSARFGLSPSDALTAAAIASGRNAKAVAKQRGLSEHTVKTHLTRIYLKTGVSSQCELAVAAWRAWSQQCEPDDQYRRDE